MIPKERCLQTRNCVQNARGPENVTNPEHRTFRFQCPLEMGCSLISWVQGKKRYLWIFCDCSDFVTNSLQLTEGFCTSEYRLLARALKA